MKQYIKPHSNLVDLSRYGDEIMRIDAYDTTGDVTDYVKSSSGWDDEPESDW